MSEKVSPKVSNQSYKDCMKPVALSKLDNNEFYTVFGLYRGLKTIDPYQPDGINIKKEYISIFNNHYISLDSKTKSFPSMIVFCKVSTFKKDDIMYDETSHSDDFNFNYSKTYTDNYDPIFGKNNKFDGENEEQTFTKTMENGMNIYVYQYYYIYVSEDAINRYVKSHADVDIEYNEEQYRSIQVKHVSFTKSMFLYFYKYLIDKKNIVQLPYIDMAKFFYKECQTELRKEDITQQEFINKIKWYFNILESGYYPGQRTNFETNKATEVDCLKKTHTKEQIEFKSSIKQDFTTSVLQSFNDKSYYYNQKYCLVSLDETELNIKNSSNFDLSNNNQHIKRQVDSHIRHSFGSSDFKFSIADVIGFKLNNNLHKMKQLVPHFKEDKDRVIMKHYMMITPKEIIDYDNINKNYYQTSKNSYNNVYEKNNVMQRYLYLVNYVYTLKKYNNANWFKLNYILKKSVNNSSDNLTYNIDVEFKLHFHHSIKKYLQFNEETQEINLLNPGAENNILSFIKFIFSNFEPSFKINTQIYNRNIITDYYLKNDEYQKFYKPPLNNSYYKSDYSKLTFKDTSIKDFNKEETGEEFSQKLNSYFTDRHLDTIINIPLFDYQKRNVIWMSEIESKIDTNQHYIDTNYLNYLNLQKIINSDNSLDNWSVKQMMTTLNKYGIIINGENSYYLDNNSKNVNHYHNYKSYFDYDYDKDKNMSQYHNDINVIKKCGNTNSTYQLQLTGGILCDDVGLGKTLSTISHLVNSKSNDNTKLENDSNSYMLNNLIILPPRLLKQWAFEIEKYVGTQYFNIKILASITDIKKMYKKKKSAKKTTTRKSKKQTSTTQEKVDEENYTSNCKTDGNTEDSVFEKADIYLMSINLFNNNNYTKYIYENYEKCLDKYRMGKRPDEPQDDFKYVITSYFDVFQIKWNRIIIDEVHESVSSIFHKDHRINLSIAQRKLVKNIIFNLQSNYRWGLSATPFQKDIYNNYGYITWLSKTLKNNMLDMNTVKRLYGNNLFNFNNEEELIYHMADYINYYLTSTETQKFQSLCISKTRKMDVEEDLDIPIVTEEIIPITLGNIEMNIYNSAKSQVNVAYRYGARERLKRLFQLCTNICISEEDVANLGIDISQPVSLEQLNQAMVKTFTKTLVLEQKKLKDLTNKKDNFKDYYDVYKSLRDFTGDLVDFKSQAYQEIYGWVRDETSYRYMDDSERNNWSKFYRHFKTELMENIIKCKENSSNLFVIVSDIMCQDEVKEFDVKEYFNDSRLLVLVNIIIDNIVKNSNSSGGNIKKDIETCEREIVRLNNQIKLFQNNDFMKEKTQEPCPICWCDFEDDTKAIITKCRHVLCIECFENLMGRQSRVSCPECREPVTKSSVITIKVGDINETPEEKQKRLEKEEAEKNKDTEKEKIPDWEEKCISKYGTKMSVLIKYLKKIFSETDDEGSNKGHRAIVFSQYENMLKLIGKTLNEFDIKNVYAKGNVHVLNKNIDAFKRDETIRVIMLSSENSNSGSNLTEASHIIMVDVLNMDKQETREVETQAIGRAVRLGQKKPVKVVRLVTQNTIESEYYEKNKYSLTNN